MVSNLSSLRSGGGIAEDCGRVAPQAAAIEEIRGPIPRDFVENYVRPERPVVFRGLAREWVACRNWTEDYLRRVYGSSMMRVLITQDSAVTYGRKGTSDRYLTLSQYFDELRDENRSLPYLSTTWDQLPDSLRSEVQTPSICRDASWVRYKFWVGRKGTVAPLHRDSPQNLYAQLHGHKRFYLIPAKQTRQVYPRWQTLGIFCDVDVENPDLDRFPRFSEAAISYCDLDPGDVLFIPSWWWHQTRAMDLCIAVNFWWADGALAWKIRTIDVAKQILGISK